MHSVPAIRRATVADAPALTLLLRDLGYPVERDGVDATLRQVLDDPGFVLVAADDERGVVGFLSLSCRPVLRLQGVAGTIEELAVRSDVRAHGVATASSSTPRDSPRSEGGSGSRPPSRACAR